MLKFAIIFTAAFGLLMLLLPGPVRELFSWIVFGDATRIAAFPPDALRYATFLHGLIGAMMVGWSISLAGLLRAAGASAPGWILASVATWFVLDSAHSIWVGVWQNAVLNLGFALLFGAGLALAPRRR